MDYVEPFSLALKTALTWATIGIIGGVLLGRMVGAFIEGNISALESVVVGGIFLVLLVMVVLSRNAMSTLLYIVLILLLIFGWPAVVEGLNKVQDKRFYQERIHHFREVLESDPLNLAARENLVDALYREGYIDEALREQSELVRLAPNDSSAVRKLEWLKEEVEQRKGLLVICRKCGHENRKGDVRCRKCESRLAVSGELVEWLSGSGFKHVALAWCVALVMITLVLFAASALPASIRVSLSLALLIAVLGTEFFYVYRRL